MPITDKYINMNKLINISVLFCLTMISCNKETAIPNERCLPLQESQLSTKSEEDSYISINISKSEALKIVSSITNQYLDRWIDISQYPVPSFTTIQYNDYGVILEDGDYSEIVSPSYTSWLLVIGPDFKCNGPQSLVHVFVNVESGEYETIVLGGRAIIEWDESRNKYTESFINSLTPNVNNKTRRIRETTNLWAVIISGGLNLQNNYSRYWNDCQDIYIKLTNTLGYDRSHIYCLVSDGVDPAYDRRTGENTYDSSPLDFDNDGIDDIQFSATKANISTVFTYLSYFVSSGDEVLVFVTDHGSSTGKIVLWGGEQLSPTELDNELDKLGESVKIDVVMGQCFSGAFTAYPMYATNRTISTACTANQYSYGNALDGADYFLHYWTAAITASATDTVNPDPDSNGYKSLREMFTYARDYIGLVGTGEIPQYSSSNNIFGFGHDLLGNDFYPELNGANVISTTCNSSYYFSNVPLSSLISWSLTGCILNISSNTILR